MSSGGGSGLPLEVECEVSVVKGLDRRPGTMGRNPPVVEITGCDVIGVIDRSMATPPYDGHHARSSH